MQWYQNEKLTLIDIVRKPGIDLLGLTIKFKKQDDVNDSKFKIDREHHYE